MPMVATERGNIHYKDYRKTDSLRAPLLLIHGAGGDYLDWSIKLRLGAEAIAIDLMGHGKSDPSGRTTIADYAQDVIAFMDALNLPQAIIAGHSMGGAIAQMMALTYPERVRALVLLGTSAYFTVNPQILAGLLSNPEETARLIVKWEWAKDVSEALKEQGVKKLLQVPAQVTHGDYVACQQFDVRERLHEITSPTLILAGDSDKMAPLNLSETLHQGIVGSELVVIKGGGHMFHLEQPEAVNEQIIRWINALQQ